MYQSQNYYSPPGVTKIAVPLPAIPRWMLSHDPTVHTSCQSPIFLSRHLIPGNEAAARHSHASRHVPAKLYDPQTRQDPKFRQ